MNNIDILEEKEKRALENVKSLLLYSSEHEYFSPFKEEEIDDMNIVLNLVSTLIAENKEKDEEIENQDKTIDRLVKEQEEREKYTHQLEAENKELKEMLKHRIEYTNKLEKDLFQNASNYVIPKSKVEENLKKAINNEIDLSKAMFEGDFTNGYIYALQFLLGKE